MGFNSGFKGLSRLLPSGANSCTYTATTHTHFWRWGRQIWTTRKLYIFRKTWQYAVPIL